jgi:hypothetical protein
VIYRTLSIFALAFTLLAAHEVKSPTGPSMSRDARLYVAPMEWQLDHYVISEIRKQGLPVQLVNTEGEADFVMTSLYQQLGSDLITPSHFIQVRIAAVNDGRAVWAGEVNDFSIVFGRLRRHGPRKAAEVILKNLRRNLTGVR